MIRLQFYFTHRIIISIATAFFLFVQVCDLLGKKFVVAFTHNSRAFFYQ